ncbi:hypothetical protein [Vibrio aestuarianus]|uniref:hypothetical protein n=1 Tax=Vibrio aestuarianus TaxID=28171 RepID=UPI00237C8536|nr:hypothetical protein [Vibrio aestuarianus]MDE1208880.1 hypothetical protein [Vibrio aestuarianus]MDE1251875.1 hypothetical protein [Vibrio aestuarianus]MDE1317718.1 hypothetical protein [Vibrio aestuarianus]
MKPPATPAFLSRCEQSKGTHDEQYSDEHHKIKERKVSVSHSTTMKTLTRNQIKLFKFYGNAVIIELIFITHTETKRI